MSQPVRIVVAGLGRAGNARVRDITGNVLGENLAILKGVISRHKPDDIKVPLMSLDDALSSSEVDAVVISTENNAHEECVRKSLEAGKHVLVEFPLTTSFSTTKNLVELAESEGVVLQEEDIGLLTDAFKELTDKMKPKPRVTKAAMNFSAALTSTAWVCDLKKGGFPTFSGINRLHMVYELFGELTVKEAKFTVDDSKREMIATMLTKDSVPIVWTETRATDSSARTFSFHFTFEDGTTMDYSPRMGPPARTSPQTAPPKGLFARDLELFLQKIRGEVGSDKIAHEKKRLMHCAEIAGKIEEAASKNL